MNGILLAGIAIITWIIHRGRYTKWWCTASHRHRAAWGHPDAGCKYDRALRFRSIHRGHREWGRGGEYPTCYPAPPAGGCRVHQDGPTASESSVDPATAPKKVLVNGKDIYQII